MEWIISQGLTSYPEALSAMEAQVSGILSGQAQERVWLVEHPPLYTSGTSSKSGDLLPDAPFPVFEAGRGGQFTYHGPGQRVAYVMLDLKARGAQDVRAYVQKLEHWVIATLSRFGVKGEMREGRVGVWVDDGKGGEAKIAAIGIRIRQWVTFHGISLNVNPDLSHYRGIVPCGISEHGVTSLAALGISASMDEVDAVLKEEFSRVF
ncbi:MAG: lipoyl(octanoyl) transferase LipB [Rickettsiales bacterium]|nr:lipoyl(octanoyl) transferase LipB [Rickettsiales bacterium]